MEVNWKISYQSKVKSWLSILIVSLILHIMQQWQTIKKRISIFIYKLG